MTSAQPPAGRGRKSRSERQAYTRRRAERTAGEATRHRNRWTIDDARTALDLSLSLSVPEVALRLGRTAAAVEGLRAKWRNGALSSSLADQLPPYRAATAAGGPDAGPAPQKGQR